MIEGPVTHQFDVAVVAPLRGHGIAQRSFETTMEALVEAGLSTVVIDSTDTSAKGIRRTAPAGILHLLRSPLLRLGGPGHLGRVQTALVFVTHDAKPPAQLRSSVHADTSVVIIADQPAVDTDPAGAADVSETIPVSGPNQILEQVRVATRTDRILWAAGSQPVLDALTRDLPPEAGLGIWPYGPGMEGRSAVPRQGSPESRPVLGRHIVTAEPAWPEDELEIRRMLPTTADWDVRLFGPHARMLRTLGRTPPHWSLHSVVGPQDLDQLDFWIPVTRKTAQILEDPAVYQAMAHGVVPILPASLRPVFGSGAAYAGPHGTRSLVRKLHADQRLYQRHSRLAVEHARSISRDRLHDVLHRCGLHAAIAPQPDPAPTPAPRDGRERFRLALVTSNGAGMGHLTRLLAIARRLPAYVEPIFISLSQAVDVVSAFDYPYAYIASRNETGLAPSAWNDYSRTRFEEELRRFTPDALLFDGTWPYRGLVAAAKSTDTPMIWSRRGMWKGQAGDRSLAHSKHFELIVEPGEFSASADRGATTRVDDASQVTPVTVLSRDELLPRGEARERLGLRTEEHVVLVTLGAGNLNDINTTTVDVIDAIKQHLPGWRILLTSNPLSLSDTSYNGVQPIQLYPIAEYANAFDLTVSAAGYNSFHEWTSACVPALWMPNTSTQTDDQVARAHYAQEIGCGLSLEDPDRSQVFEAMKILGSPGTLERMRSVLEEHWLENGAQAAAELIAEQVMEGHRVSI